MQSAFRWIDQKHWRFAVEKLSMDAAESERQRRIRALRERAQHVRTSADEIQNPVTREALLRTARTYDMLADLEDARSNPLPPKTGVSK
jgi:hypothetical protein